MTENRTEVALGALVVAVAIGFLIYAAQMTGLGPSRTGSYDLTAGFRSAEGVVVGTDVRVAGVRVGSVTEITLNPQTFEAEVLMRVDEGLRLPEDTTAIVASEGLLGGTFMELQPGGAPFDIEPGGRILDTQSAVSLITLLLRFVTGSEDSAGDGAAQ